MNDTIEVPERIVKGWLNGTTRGQGYFILATTGLIGAGLGVVGTAAYVRRRFILVEKRVQPEVPTNTNVTGEIF
jgi:hypothetical protein